MLDVPKSVALRGALLIASHLVAALFGFAVVAALRGSEVAAISMGTPERRLGVAFASLLAEPSRENVSKGLEALAAAQDRLTEPVPSVLRLRLLTIAARTSRGAGDIERAIDACQARSWPRCDRESILSMGVIR